MCVRFRGESDGASWVRGIPVIGPRDPHSQPELSRCTKLRCAFLEPLHKPTEIFGTFLPFGLCVEHQQVLWTPSLLGSTDRPRPVLRFGLVMARASTDQKGFITGLRHHLYGCPCLRSCTNFPFTDQPANQPTNQPTTRQKGTRQKKSPPNQNKPIVHPGGLAFIETPHSQQTDRLSN